jgi:RimJ/RimL family protein N-acetyltransferase
MRRYLLPALLVVSIALLCAILTFVGAWNFNLLGWVFVAVLLAFATVTIMGMGVIKEEIRVDPWTCASCGAYEAQFLRQCGACEAYRVTRLTTESLVLREWRDSDLEPFAAINSDPRVMEFQPAPLDRAESDALAGRIREAFAKYGFGLWAVEVPGVAPFIGFIGLSVPGFEAPFTPCVELACRLAFDHWDQGYATEGAWAAVEFGFKQARLKEIVSFTAPANARSVRVMEKIGMKRDPAEDFDHPALPVVHRLRRHVLYRLSRA